MEATFVTYLVYVALSVCLTVWVARTLSKNGIAFLSDVFRGNPELATSVNHLLVVGFYLLNLGFVSLNLTLGLRVHDAAQATEALSRKMGLVALVLGGVHFFNLWVLHRLRQRALLTEAPPPGPPDRLLSGSLPPAAPLAGAGTAA